MEKTKMIVSLRLWNLNKDNEATLEIRKNDTILEYIEDFFNLPDKIDETASVNRGIKISDRVYINQAQKFKWPDLNEEEINESGFCYALRDQAAILVDGTVVPCCLDHEGVIKLGNIHYSSFSEIIDSERVNNIINGFSKRHVVEELCKKCGYIKKFN
jgi:radical SAM protein with 4Fe4S-binding SPASM domain